MLIRFSFKNFKSFKDENCLDMEATSLKEHEYNLIETGRREMSLYDAIIISDYFNVSMDNLFNKKALNSEEFMQIAKRYFENDKIPFEEKKEILKKMIYYKSESEANEILQRYKMTQKV